MGIPRFFRWLSERYPQINQTLSTNVTASGNTSGIDFRELFRHADGDTSSTAAGATASSVVSRIAQVQNLSASSFQVDCLYLDLNGVLHNCTHANKGRLDIVHDKQEIWLAVMAYIDSLVQIARPKMLLYIAVDGVAPRAKMNQQRGRRFRAARDRATAAQVARFMADKVPKETFIIPPQTPADKADFDSNCITPGTDFMFELMDHLRFIISKQLVENAAWQDLEVILSGPDVPGEGEHKIMEFIRALRIHPDYPPSMSHCLQGLDADLIMLSLMTHEPRFTLLRETVTLDREPRWITETKKIISAVPSFQLLHINLVREYLVLDILVQVAEKTRKANRKTAQKKKAKARTHQQRSTPELVDTDETDDSARDETGRHPLNDLEDFETTFGFRFDGERAINDFLLFCCLVGNDFLPHLQFADFGKGGLEALMSIYTSHLAEWKQRQLHSEPWLLGAAGKINWTPLLFFLERCCEMEDALLAENVADEQWLASKSGRGRRGRSDTAAGREPYGGEEDSDGESVMPLAAATAYLTSELQEAEMSSPAHGMPPSELPLGLEVGIQAAASHFLRPPNGTASATVVDELSSPSPSSSTDRDVFDRPPPGSFTTITGTSTGPTPVGGSTLPVSVTVGGNIIVPLRSSSLLSEVVETDEYVGPTSSDWARAGGTLRSLDDARHFYYWRKMHFNASLDDGKKELVRLVKNYLEGMQWCMSYYFDGVPSWSWFYSFYYAPFTHDLVEFLKMHPSFEPRFELGEPLKPFEQLMAVLPPTSSKLLPERYHPLMLSKNSPIKNYYPAKFLVDREGCRTSWAGVTLLPFVNEQKLLSTMRTVEAAPLGVEGKNREVDFPPPSLPGPLPGLKEITARAVGRGGTGDGHPALAPKVTYSVSGISALKTAPQTISENSTQSSPLSVPPQKQNCSWSPSIPPRTEEEDARNRAGVAALYINPEALVKSRLVCSILRNLDLDPTMGAEIQDYLVSSVPCHLPPVVARRVIVCRLPNFRKVVQREMKHSATVLPAFMMPNYHPSWFSSDLTVGATTSSNELLNPERARLCSRIADLNLRKGVVQAFYRITRGPSLLVTLKGLATASGSVPSLADQFGQLTTALTSTQDTLKLLLGGGTYFPKNFSTLPAVCRGYPQKTLSRIIGIWHPEQGYVPLHPEAPQIPCPLVTTDDITREKGILHPGVSIVQKTLKSPDWKLVQLCARDRAELFYQVSNNFYKALWRRGVNFIQEKAGLTENEQHAYQTFLSALFNYGSLAKGLSRGEFPPLSKPQPEAPIEFCFKDILVELVDHTEIAENLGGKPLMRFHTAESRLCFLPELQLVPPSIVSTTTSQLQAASPPVVKSFRVRSKVQCSANCAAFGLVGKVERTPSGSKPLVAAYEVVETARERWLFQKQICQILMTSLERIEWLSLDDVADRLSIPVQPLKWLMRYVGVRTNERGATTDIGLGLMREVRSLASATPAFAGVPGFSCVARSVKRNCTIATQFFFTPAVLPLIREVQQYVPMIIPVLMTALKAKRYVLHVNDLFKPDTAACDMPLEGPEWCLGRYVNWLQQQPFKTIGSMFHASQALDTESIEEVFSLMRTREEQFSTRLPDTNYVAGNGSVIRLLYSPVCPARLTRLVEIGQRVVTIKNGGPIPPGMFGVVVGLFPNAEDEEAEIVGEVLLEKPCIGGTNLAGRMSFTLRGALVPLRSLMPVPPYIKVSHKTQMRHVPGYEEYVSEFVESSPGSLGGFSPTSFFTNKTPSSLSRHDDSAIAPVMPGGLLPTPAPPIQILAPPQRVSKARQSRSVNAMATTGIKASRAVAVAAITVPTVRLVSTERSPSQTTAVKLSTDTRPSQIPDTNPSAETATARPASSKRPSASATVESEPRKLPEAVADADPPSPDDTMMGAEAPWTPSQNWPDMPANRSVPAMRSKDSSRGGRRRPCDNRVGRSGGDGGGERGSGGKANGRRRRGGTGARRPPVV